MATLTFGEIQKKKYTSFSRMADEKAAQHVDAVKYIEGIARTAGVNISEWDAKEIFGTGTGNELVLDKAQINKLFFEHMEKVMVVAAPVEGQQAIAPNDPLSEDQKAALLAIEANIVQNQIATYQNDRDSNLSNAASRYRDFEEYLRRAAASETLRRKLAGERTIIAEQVAAIAQSQFWQFVGMDNGNGVIKFKTRQDIVLTHRNPSAGVNIVVNLGKFRVDYKVRDSSLRVIGIEGNTNADGYMHPHIDNGGGICWGNAGNQAAGALGKFQIVEPFQLLAAVLSGYNPSSPYRPIERFYELAITPAEKEKIAELDRARATAQVAMTAAVTGRTVQISTNPIPPPSVMAPTPVPEAAAEAAPAAVTTVLAEEIVIAAPAPTPAATPTSNVDF